MANEKKTKVPGQTAPPTTSAQQGKQATAPINDIDWSTTGVTGMENVTQQDLGIPFLSICQAGSPEFKKSHADYATKRIEGIQEGDIFNTVTREIVYSQGGDPMLFIPCMFERLWVEWKTDGGLVKMHTNANIMMSAKRNEKGQDILPNGNMIVPTAYFHGFYEDDAADGGISKCAIGMASTQLKKSRAWLNLAHSIKLQKPDGSKFVPPLFSHRYALSTEAESNEKGSWFGWKIAVHEIIKEKELVAKAVDIAKSVTMAQRQALPPAGEQAPDEEDVPY